MTGLHDRPTIIITIFERIQEDAARLPCHMVMRLSASRRFVLLLCGRIVIVQQILAGDHHRTASLVLVLCAGVAIGERRWRTNEIERNRNSENRKK